MIACRLLLALLVFVGSLALPAGVSAASMGADAAALAAAQMGKPYVLGLPVRPGPLASSPAAFDCSGLIWWIAGQLGVTGFPLVAATQAQVGERLSVSPWSGELPVGALLFLADPAQGAGITHVSIHLGGNIAADCYNEGDGCIAHDVSNDNYYYRHWAYATYPWGDAAEYASGGAGVPPVGAGSGSGSDGSVPVTVYNTASGGGVIRGAVASPLAQVSDVVTAAVSEANTAIGGSDPEALAATQMEPVHDMMGWYKALDALIPLRVLSLLAAFLTILIVMRAISVVRYLVDLLPG